MQASRGPVLVVDDDAAFARAVADVLEAHGLNALTAEAGHDALRLAGERDCPVAVVDLVMPEMGGIELADALRVLNPDTQIVVLTGAASKEAAIEGIEHRVYAFLEKATIDLERLCHTVRSAAEHGELRRLRRDLMRRISDSNDLLKSLNDVAASLTGEPHVDGVLRQLVRSAGQLFDAASAVRAVLFRRGATGLAVTAAAGHRSEGLVGMSVAAGHSLGAAALEANKVIVAPTAAQDARFDARLDALGSAEGWLACAPLSHRDVAGALLLEGPPGSAPDDMHAELLGTLARQAAVAVDNARQHEQAANYFTHTSELLVSLLDRVDPGAAGHARKVAELADLISRRMGLEGGERRTIHFAALLHDIGRVRLPAALLDTRKPLDEAGQREIRKHPELGFELLRPIGVWQDVVPIVHAHHERWDGSGYPRGLDGQEIPLGARIVAVADAFDAMMRPLRPGSARSPEQALAEVEAGAGTQFDPKVVRLFVAAFRQSRGGDRG